MSPVLPRERLIVSIAGLLEGVRHVAVGASSPIPDTLRLIRTAPLKIR